MLARALLVWLVFIAVETAHGTLRALVLEPALGRETARRVGFGVGVLIVLAVAWLCARWLGARTPRRLLGIGALWALLTFAFELTLARIARGLSWEEALADYDLASGGWMGLGLLVLLVAPWIAARLRGMAGGDSPRSRPPRTPPSGEKRAPEVAA